LAVSKFQVPLARQIIDAVLGKNAAQVPPRLIQIAGAEDGVARQQIGVPDHDATACWSFDCGG
jgi:hypothetical protein